MTREEAIETLGHVVPFATQNGEKIAEAIEMAIEALSADAAQGEWDSNQACSICGCQPWYEHDIHTLHYCPNCGARMKGGAE